jgi:hypothetical protein
MDFAAADPHWTSRGGFPGVKFLIGARMGLCDEAIRVAAANVGAPSCYCSGVTNAPRECSRA